MDPRTGYTYDLSHEADPPALGAKIPADVALNEGLVEGIDAMEPEVRKRLAEMAENREELVAVGPDAAQRARLGDRELRRRRQRRR